MKNHILLFIGLSLFVHSTGQALDLSCPHDLEEAAAGRVPAYSNFAGPDKETDQFLKAKGHVFKRNWKKAADRLEAYLEKYPSGKYKDEALYWLAQSINKLSRKEEDPEKVIALKERAIDELNLLIDHGPESPWMDDAQALKIEMSGELALMGREEHRGYIEEIIETHNKKESDLKMFALNELIELKPSAAIPILENILSNESDPAVRKKGLLLLALNFSEEALDILLEVERQDPDSTVRNEAASWLRQIKSRSIPVQLNYYGYVARLKDREDHELIPENRLNIYKLPPIRSKSKRKVEKAIAGFFNKKLSDLKFATNSFGGVDYFGSMNISHNLAGFRIRVLQEGFVKEYDRISGKVSFYDTEEEKEHKAAYTVDSRHDRLLAMRRGEEVAVLVLQFESNEETEAEKMESAEPVHYTVFNNVFGCIVHSSRQSWSNDEMTADRAVMDYGRAKVEIPGEIGRWILIGDILLNRKDRSFIARNASLFDSKGDTVAKAPRIIVPVDDPGKYEVIR